MSDVTLMIDGREVTVPTGTGLVEAAAEVGIEIPVFCYEPRIGPAVGACRMCLVEIEGVPKLQAACATAVRDGMVVSSVGDKAREAQEAVLEFLLLNHPLDCPVCDKGGECPLQDQAFRWGSGKSRFVEQKRVNDKPIPISPLIALDRERCILCWRCSRFSAEVSEDLQLIARQRGARSVIATFEGRPWEGHHTGNVIELCPVGALTSTQYRFHGRPWETSEHPSISPWDPAGTNVFNAVREGKVVRVLSRRNDSVDNGWIDDRTRFAYTAMYGKSRITSAAQRPFRDRPVGNRPIVEATHDEAMRWLHDKLAQGKKEDNPELWVLSGFETLEVARAVQVVAEQTGGRVVAMPGASSPTPSHTARIEDLRTVQNIVVVGHDDLLDSAPGLELWLRKARQRGASITVAGIGGTRIEGAGVSHLAVGPEGLDECIDALCAKVLSETKAGNDDSSCMVIYADGELSPASQEKIVTKLSLQRQGSGVLAVCETANARGLAALGVEQVDTSTLFSHTGGVVYFGSDPSMLGSFDDWAPAIKKAAWVVSVDTLPASFHEAVDLVIPGVWSAEQDGTMVNLEGRIQRLTVGAGTPEQVVPPLRWLGALARQLGATSVTTHAAGVFRQIASAYPERFPVSRHGDIPSEGVLGVSAAPMANEGVAEATSQPHPGDGHRFVARLTRNMYDAREVRHSEAMQFLLDDATITVNRDDARELGLLSGDVAQVQTDETTFDARIRTSRSLMRGFVRVPAGSHNLAPHQIGWVSCSVTKSEQSAAQAVALKEL